MSTKGALTKAKHEPSAMEVLSRAIHERMNDPSVANVWGGIGVNQHGPIRRIVWARVDPSQIQAPEDAGGKLEGGVADGVRYNITRIREQVMDLHIYGEHERACEQILKNVVAAIDLTTRRTRFLTERWTSETVENDSNTRRPKVIVRAVFRLLVPDVITPLQPVAGFEHECGILPEEGTSPLTPGP